MKNEHSPTTVNPHQQLLAILRRFNISPVTFHGLRSDAYEKHVARRSLTELEQLYAMLFETSMDYRQIQTRCPRWEKGHKFDGQPPSLQTLSTIKRRLLTDRTANHLGRLEEFANLLQAHAAELAGEIPSTPLQSP